MIPGAVSFNRPPNEVPIAAFVRLCRCLFANVAIDQDIRRPMISSVIQIATFVSEDAGYSEDLLDRQFNT